MCALKSGVVVTDTPYVRSVSLNGVELTGFAIRHEELLKGGELVFRMGTGPVDGHKDILLV